MQLFKKIPAEKTGLEKAIDEVLREMEALTADDPEYAKMVVQLQKLHSMKTIDRPPRVSPDTLALIAGNLAVTLMIVNHEYTGVITTKARDFWHQIRPVTSSRPN